MGRSAGSVFIEVASEFEEFCIGMGLSVMVMLCAL